MESIEDVLRIEGVKAKGYGIIPRAVMTDTDLSIVAKAIYAYFCSLSGEGKRSFPGRERILHDLGIHKDTYYVGLQQIKDAGYILVQQEHAHGGKGNGFSRNIYTITAVPEKYRQEPPTPSQKNLYTNVRSFGLDACGYGVIPFAVMTDERISVRAKAVYAYISSCVGSHCYWDMSPEKMQYHLGVSKVSCRGYVRELTQYDYIIVTQLYKDGRLTSTNRYSVNQMPQGEHEVSHKILSIAICPPNQSGDSEGAQAPDSGGTQIQSIQKTGHTNSVDMKNRTHKNSAYEKPDTQGLNLSSDGDQAPSTDSKDAQIQCIQKTRHTKNQTHKKQDTQIQDTQKPDTIINSSLPLTVSNNKYIYHQSDSGDSESSREPEKMDVIDAVKEQISYSELPNQNNLLNVIVDVICSVYQSTNPKIYVRGAEVPTPQIKERFRLLRKEHIAYVMDRFLDLKRPVHNPIAYLRTSLCNATLTYELCGKETPCGASGQLGEAELEAIRWIMAEL